MEAKQYVTKQRGNKYIETNENEIRMIQNLRDAAKAVLLLLLLLLSRVSHVQLCATP